MAKHLLIQSERKKADFEVELMPKGLAFYPVSKKADNWFFNALEEHLIWGEADDRIGWHVEKNDLAAWVMFFLWDKGFNLWLKQPKKIVARIQRAMGT